MAINRKKTTKKKTKVTNRTNSPFESLTIDVKDNGYTVYAWTDGDDGGDSSLVFGSREALREYIDSQLDLLP